MTRSAPTLAVLAMLAASCGRRAEDEADVKAPPTTTEAHRADDTACPDPVAGLWSALFFEDGQWQEYRVELARMGDTLYCLQESYAWPGRLTEIERPRCPGGQPAMNITTLRCEAQVDGDQLTVASVEQLTRRHTCKMVTGIYTFDEFTGTRTGNTWRAVNRTTRDGHVYEQRVTFRRLSCAP